MFNTNAKIGKTIAVCGCRQGAGTSTVAALTASLLAAKGNRVLLLSTDADIPYDAVSMLSGDVAENYLDEVIALETSNALTSEKLSNYIQFLSDNLGYLRASTKIPKLTKTASKTINNIINMACYTFQYIVVDISNTHTIGYGGDLVNKADLIIHTIRQDHKVLYQVAQSYKDQFGKDKFVVPVITDYDEYIPITPQKIAKILNVDEVFPIHRDSSIFKAVATRTVASLSYKKSRKNVLSGLFKKPNDAEEITAIDEVSHICDLVEQALTPKETDGDE